MKKIASIAAIAVFAVAFTSCKKDYTCECSTTSGGTTSTALSYEIKDAKKKDAETLCSGSSTTSSGGVTVTQTCTLK